MPKKTCVNCGVSNCYRLEGDFPSFCPTTALDNKELNENIALYKANTKDAKLAKIAAQLEGQYYGKLTRVEEIMAFARKLKAKKIGIGSCVGLLKESQMFAKILKVYGFEVVGVCCKVGATDKTEIGLEETDKIIAGCQESMCNPIMQAQFLNKEETDLNVIVGLCVGHDILFTKHAKAPTTTLIVKDRVLGHNPVAALHNTHFYYKRLLDKKLSILED